VAYSSVARDRVFDVPPLEALATARDATAGTVPLAWLRVRGTVPTPKSSPIDPIVEHHHGFGLELRPDAVPRIDATEETTRLVDPPSAPGNPT
jgi:2,5-diketo-D-gluconate reductase B